MQVRSRFHAIKLTFSSSLITPYLAVFTISPCNRRLLRDCDEAKASEQKKKTRKLLSYRLDFFYLQSRVECSIVGVCWLHCIFADRSIYRETELKFLNAFLISQPETIFGMQFWKQIILISYCFLEFTAPVTSVFVTEELFSLLLLCNLIPLIA